MILIVNQRTNQQYSLEKLRLCFFSTQKNRCSHCDPTSSFHTYHGELVFVNVMLGGILSKVFNCSNSILLSLKIYKFFLFTVSIFIRTQFVLYVEKYDLKLRGDPACPCSVETSSVVEHESRPIIIVDERAHFLSVLVGLAPDNTNFQILSGCARDCDFFLVA